MKVYQDDPVFSNVTSGEHFITINDKRNMQSTVTTTVLKYPKFFTPNNDGFNDLNIPDLAQQCTYFYFFDRYGKLLKVLQLPLAGTEDFMVRIYHQMITGLL
jgi:hypothetical protein